MDYKNMKIEDIIKWCQENNQVEWLKKEAAKEVVVERYSKRIKVWSEEKQKEVWVADKNSDKVKDKQPITFIQIKKDFVEKFMPEIAPKAKSSKPNMYDLIANL